MSSINAFLLTNNLRIATNPCVSPDFCLDWPALLADVKAGKVCEYPLRHQGRRVHPRGERQR
jgi:hypothetical protein